MSLTTSPIVEGKYEILSKIREGGMGAIYLARHRLLNELRVIKVMRPHMADKDSDRKRFLREAQTATRLKHPNIATLYDFAIEEDGALYMVLEFIDGINLKDLISSCGVPPVPLAVEIARQSLSALGYLHRGQVVHRDISPDNLMLTSDEGGAPVVKMIDLGIARHLDASDAVTADGSFIGKLQYCSPEQLRFGAGAVTIDVRSDLFSFGLVLYELLIGQRAFKTDAPAMLLAARAQAVPLDFEEKDPTGRIPAPLRDVVARAVQLDREARFQTAGEFSKALEKTFPVGATIVGDAIARYLLTAREARPSKSFTTLSGSADQKVFDAEFGLSRPSVTLPPGPSEVSPRPAVPRTAATGRGARTIPTVHAASGRTVQPPYPVSVSAPSSVDIGETVLEPPSQVQVVRPAGRSHFLYFAAIAVVILSIASGIAIWKYRPSDQTKVDETPIKPPIAEQASQPGQAQPKAAPVSPARRALIGSRGRLHSARTPLIAAAGSCAKDGCGRTSGGASRSVSTHPRYDSPRRRGARRSLPSNVNIRKGRV